MNKKTLFIILASFAGVFLLCLCCIGVSFLGFNSVMKTAIQVNNQELLNLCKQGGSLTQNEYESLFTISYRGLSNRLATEDVLRDTFPSDYDCNDLKVGGLMDVIKQKRSLNVETVNGATSVKTSFTNSNSKMVTVVFVRNGTNWQVSNIIIN